MWIKRTGMNLLRIAATLSVAGVTLATSCGANEMRVVVAGLEAVASSLDGFERDRGDDITFGEWLISELND
jgi:hypothetical protein